MHAQAQNSSRKKLQCDDFEPKIATIFCKEADYSVCKIHLEDPDFQDGLRIE